MTKLRTVLSAALIVWVLAPATTAQARDLQCNHTLAQYTEALAQLEQLAAEANAKADVNPLYISDVQYYASVLRDARQCVKSLSPVTTAAR
jgi:hypothetical protein